MKKSSLTKITAALVVTAIVLSGCGSAEKEPERENRKGLDREVFTEMAESESTQETEDTADGFTPEEMDLIKYNYYVELNNDIVEIMDSIDYYFEVVAYEEEFSLLPDTGLTYGYRVYGKNTDILDDCVMLADMEPDYGELDLMVKKMEEPLRALMDTFLDISRSNDYAENQYQKAKEYHAVVYANADALAAVAYEFVDEIGELGNERMAEEEERLKEEGMLINYNASRAISIGRAVLDEAYSQGVSDENLTDLDLAEIQKLHDELVAVVADFNAATEDNDQLVKESLSNSRPFDGLLDGLISALEWMMKQAESGVLPDMSGSGAPLGSMAHFSYVLGQCIDRYNSVFVD